MAATVECDYCHHYFAFAADRCQHCARPGLFPNVRAAESTDEERALADRYGEAVGRACATGAEAALRALEAALEGSKAIIARPLQEVERLASSDNEIYATYYNLLDAGVKLPDGERRLAVAKLADRITPWTKEKEFPDLLLVQGRSSADDDFVEVHVYGTLTVRSLERIVVTAPKDRPGRVRLKALTERLRNAGVVLEVE